MTSKYVYVCERYPTTRGGPDSLTWQYFPNGLNQFFFSLFGFSSDETTQVNHSGMITQVTSDGDGYGVWRRPRSESSADAESVYMTNAVLSDSGYAHHSRRSSVCIIIV